MAFIDSYVETTDVPPLTFEMTIVAQDAQVLGEDGRILRAGVRVPAGRLEAGPRSSRFHVVDYEIPTGVLHEPADLTDQSNPDSRGRACYVDRFTAELASDEELLTSRAFHAQNVYAIAARTLASFENALGRRLQWGFDGHQLYLVPHAFVEANAYYSDSDRAVLFGDVICKDGDDDSDTNTKDKRRIHTCLSHDVVAHETAHAVLDGLRHRYLEPGLPDQAAFHEALADLVALLSLFSLHEVVAHLLHPDVDEDGRMPAGAVAPDALRASALFGMAEELGKELNRDGRAMRQSGLRIKEGTAWRDSPAFEEPHLRGEILVKIVIDVLIEIWHARTLAITVNGRLDRARAAEEGAKAAGHLLTMILRAIDYLPPVEFEFVDFLDAALTSDTEMSPDDDRFHYRDKLAAAFAKFGIRASGTKTFDLTDGGFVPLYHSLNFSAMRTDTDEVFRFIWENARQLQIDTSVYTHVQNVRPAVRVGPDGLIVHEAVADYVQMVDLEAAELADQFEAWGAGPGDDIALPPNVAPDTKLQLWGGGTLIFDQFGRAKYHIRKPLQDWRRQRDRLRFLARRGLRDRSGRFGFSSGAATGQDFAALHDPADLSEVW